MAEWIVKPGRLNRALQVPPSKSHTLRALLFALMAKGVSCIENPLDSPDTLAMLRAIEQFGAQVQRQNGRILVTGTGGAITPAENVIDCGNSGQVLRFIGALAALSPTYTILTGDASIRHSRPAKPLLDGLTGLGALAVSSRGDGYAPLIIKGPFIHTQATLSGEDSQPVSGLLIASAFAPHPISLAVRNPGETPWIDLTLDWLKRLGLFCQAEGYSRYQLKGNGAIDAFHYRVPGDFSSAAYGIAAALITQSEMRLSPLDMSDSQGDKIIIPLLEQMGAQFTYDPLTQTLHIKKSAHLLQGRRIDVNPCIDALPILAVLGCYAEGQTELFNGAIARKKESDRIACIVRELKKMGANIEERPDGLIARRSTLSGAFLETHRDHRLVLSLAVAALGAAGESTLTGSESAAKTYPTFLEDVQTHEA